VNLTEVGLFDNAIKAQGTAQQWEYYAGAIYKLKIIGCFAMTELGHSFLRGLETTATYDKILNTVQDVSKCITIGVRYSCVRTQSEHRHPIS